MATDIEGASAISMGTFHAAVELGDVVTIDAYLKQDHVRSSVDATEAFIAAGHATGLIFQQARPGQDGSSYPWYYNPETHTLLFDTVVKKHLVEVLAWFFSPARAAYMGVTLAWLLPSIAQDAVGANDCEMVEWLLTSEIWRISPREQRRQALLDDLLRTAAASRCDTTMMIQLLVAHGANVNDTYVLSTYAGTAATTLQLDMLDTEGVCVVGADVLSSAVYYSNQASALWLLRHGVDFSSVCNPPLHEAAREGDFTMIKLLLEDGFTDVDARNLRKQTPLMVVLHKNLTELEYDVHFPPIVARELLNAGANVALKDVNGWTALHHSINKQYPEVVERLLERGANVHDRTTAGQTMTDMLRLDLIAAGDVRKELEILLAYGADPRIVGSTGHSAVDRLLERSAGREFMAAKPEYFVTG